MGDITIFAENSYLLRITQQRQYEYDTKRCDDARNAYAYEKFEVAPCRKIRHSRSLIQKAALPFFLFVVFCIDAFYLRLLYTQRFHGLLKEYYALT